MEEVPFYLHLLFVAITAITFFLFYRSAGRSTLVLLAGLLWLTVQALPALTGFYTVTSGIPPRFTLSIGPPLIAIAALFLTKGGRAWLDRLSLKDLTLLHSIRVPVELGLLGLYFYGGIPQVMTFEGSNLDVLSGLSAPIVFYAVFVRRRGGRLLLLAWNFLCLGLLLNIVANAILAAPFDFQILAFGQPNRAILYFPFVWLPACIVPIVLVAHLASIRQLILYPERVKRPRAAAGAGLRASHGEVVEAR